MAASQQPGQQQPTLGHDVPEHEQPGHGQTPEQGEGGQRTENWGERREPGKAIARGGKTDEHVAGADEDQNRSQD